MFSQVLAAEDMTWRCAARLATRTPGGVSQSERSRFLAWVIKNNGRVVSKGLGKILHGDRDVDSVTAGADLCDSACLKKVLHYISAITDGRESPDDWPTMATLTAPSGDDVMATGARDDTVKSKVTKITKVGLDRMLRRAKTKDLAFFENDIEWNENIGYDSHTVLCSFICRRHLVFENKYKYTSTSFVVMSDLQWRVRVARMYVRRVAAKVTGCV